MNKLGFFTVTVLFINLPLMAIDRSPFESCKDVFFIKEGQYQAEKGVWDSAISKCKDKIQVVPEFGLLSTKYKDSPTLVNSLAAIDFLSEVGKRTVSSIKSNINALKTSEKCLNGIVPTKSELEIVGKNVTCEQLVNLIKERMKANRPDQRFELAFLGQINLNYAENALKTLDSSKLIDESLDNSGGLISGGVPHPKMERLNKEERAKVKAEYDRELKSIRKNWETKIGDEAKALVEKMGIKSNDSRFKKFYELELKEREKGYLSWGRAQLFANQKKHEQKYLSIATKSPFLLYVGKENATNAEITKTVQKLIESATKELSRSEKALKSATVNYGKYTTRSSKGDGKQDAIDDLLYFLGNTPIIEAALQDDKRGCSTANGLIEFVSQEKVREQLVILGGMFGGLTLLSAKAPAILTSLTGVTWSSTAVGAIFGAPVGLYFEANAIKEAVLAEDKFNAGVGDLAKVKETRDSLAIQTLLHPLDYIGMGGALGKAVKLTEVSAMKKAGLTDATIKDLIRHSESGNTKTAIEAQREIARYGWKEIVGKKPSLGEMELLESLAKSGAIPKDSKSFKVLDTMKVIQKLNREEQAGVAVMNGLNPTGARSLLLLHQSLDGKTPELFVKRLEELGVSKQMAQKMCVCSRVCPIRKAEVRSLQNSLICSL